MKHTLNAIQSNFSVFPGTIRRPVAIGRLLLVFATISLLSAPLTQHIWSWDHFLHGGQDFESGTLAILITLCLSVLLSQICKRRVDGLFDAGYARALGLNRDLRESSRMATVFDFCAAEMNEAPAGIYSLPLKI